VKEETLKIGKELLNKMPELKTKDELEWTETGAGDNLRLLSILLKGNAIPTKSLSFYGNKQFERGV